MAQYNTRIYAVPFKGGTPRIIVDRPGMNSTPQYSPDGARIAFVTTNGPASLMSPRALAVAFVAAPLGAASSARIRSFPLDDAWVSDLTAR